MPAAHRLLCLGDSYTVGEGVEPTESWPHQLTAALRRDGVPVDSPEIIARTGWTTDELQSGLHAAAPRGPFALVTLMIGVNDQYRGRPVGEFRRRFRSLLAMAIRLAGEERTRGLVVSIPDWGVTPYALGRDRRTIAADIDRRNALMATIAEARGVAFVNVTTISRALADSNGALTEDGLHPSTQQYSRWCELLLPAARKCLGH